MSRLPTIAAALTDLPHVPIDALVPFQGELKELSEREYNKLKKSILENGIFVPFFVWNDGGIGRIIDGHQRERVMSREGWQMDVPVIYIDAADEQEAKRKLLLVSSQYGRVTQEGWDAFTFDLDSEWLKESVHFDALPFVFGEWENDGNGTGESQDAEPQTPERGRQTLAERFVIPPFSVLDARQGYWQERKRAWLALGIQSELGRGENLQGLSEANDEYRYNKNEYLARIGRGPLAGTLGAIAPNEGGENGILASPGKYAGGNRGGKNGNAQ